MEDNYLALLNGTLINGNGGDPIPDSCILIQGKKIAAVGKRDEIKIPKGAIVKDISGRFALPGLMDAHVHLVAATSAANIPSRFWTLENPPAVKVLHAYKNAQKTLLAGFTTLRNAGNVTTREPEDIILRDAIRENIVQGPRILACGGGVSMTAGHGALYYPPYLQVIPELGFGERTADGPDEVRKEVRRRLRMGADFIKIYTSGGVATTGDKSEWNNWTPQEIKAAVEEAHNFGKPVASHAQGLEGIKNAVRAGVDTIEHGCILDDEAIEMMLARGTAISSTLVVLKTIALDKGRLPASQTSIEKAKRITEKHFESIGKAYQAGVKIVFATDTFNFLRHGENAAEFRYLVDAGLDSMGAIQSATKNAAEALGIIEDTGTLLPGKMADLLVVSGNPLADIRILEQQDRIELILKEGVIVKNLKEIKNGF